MHINRFQIGFRFSETNRERVSLALSREDRTLLSPLARGETPAERRPPPPLLPVALSALPLSEAACPAMILMLY